VALSRADLNSEAICKARHQVVYINTGSDVASGSNADIKCWTFGYAALTRRSTVNVDFDRHHSTKGYKPRVTKEIDP
jgi:hypothetical protein